MPVNQKKKIVTLTTSDDEKFEVERQVVEHSLLLKSLIEDVSDFSYRKSIFRSTIVISKAIPLPNVNAKIFEKVLEYCKHHKDDLIVEEEDLPTKPKSFEDIDPWDYQYAKLEKESLFELILAANYLDIKPLITVCCKMVASRAKGKTLEQVREEFGVENDFTPGEEAEIRKENAWLENR